MLRIFESLAYFSAKGKVERLKTKDVSQRVEVDATLLPPVSSISVKTLTDVTPGGDHIASFDAEQRMSNYLQLLGPR